MYSPKNWEFWTICQLATCDDHRPCIGQGLSSYAIITPSVKRVICGAYIYVGAQGLLLRRCDGLKNSLHIEDIVDGPPNFKQYSGDKDEP
ncbi:hypothetical protein TNCV_3828241 [Trichonephila clavipes]|nr:hypothetical protein TNCV_3828241 [Trichonephila clavipes]